VFDKDSGQFVFHPGPIFAELVLADEINRATPKSQSALLEAMEEGQVTIEGATRPLPEPFFVIATQNPVSSGGTFALPESQLDRFLMRLSLGYPAQAAEKALLLGDARRELLPRLQAILDHAELARLQAEVPKVRASDALIDYVLRLVEATRSQPQFAWGLSPRASLALLAAARAWALLAERDYVIPEDVQAVLPSVVGHRLRERADPTGHGGGSLVQWLLREVPAL
jgi:MoxR-like ATPase